MRYIDDMIKDIPLEELTGGTEMNNSINDVKAVIPDSSTEEEKDYVQTKENTINTELPQPRPITSGSGARVRGKGLSIIAAAAALVIAAGGVMTYLGAAKNIGPLASAFSSADDVSDNGGDVTAETKKKAEIGAKAVFTVINGYTADKISDGRQSEIRTGLTTTSAKVLANGDEQQEKLFEDANRSGGDAAYYAAEIDKGLMEQFKEMFDANDLGPCEIAYYIDTQYRVTWAQWRDLETGYVGQYPVAGGGTTELGKFNNGLPDDGESVPDGEISISFESSSTSIYPGIFFTSVSNTNIAKERVDQMREELAKNKQIITPDESKPKLYGPGYTIRIADEKGELLISTSDRMDAPLIVNGEYCRCDYLQTFLNSVRYGFAMEGGDTATFSYVDKDQDAITYYDSPLGRLEGEARQWYKDFLSKNYQPVEDVGAESEPSVFKYVQLPKGDAEMPVVIANTKYANANVQVDGKYYKVEDTSIFDLVDRAFACEETLRNDKEEQLGKLRS